VTKRTLPRSADYDSRAIALARRLGFNPPPQPLSDDQWEGLFAYIGVALAEKEPEFQWGQGRRPGSKNKQQNPVAMVTKQALKRRRRREPRLIDLIGGTNIKA